VTRSLSPLEASKYELIPAERGEHHAQGTPGVRRARQDVPAGLQVLRRGRGRAYDSRVTTAEPEKAIVDALDRPA